MSHGLLGILALSLLGCSVLPNSTRLPSTLGEHASGYGYVPLDGLAIEETLESPSCKHWRDMTTAKSIRSIASDITGSQAGQDPFVPLLQSLPDISVRFAVASFDISGGLTFGPAKITAKNQNYRAILDYVNVDAIPVSFWITAIRYGKPTKLSDLTVQYPADGYQAKMATFLPKDGELELIKQPEPESQLLTVPVYVGIGMRLSADITALEAGVPLVSLGALGVEAQAKRLVGTLTVQTIGITGESVATSLPLPSKLDQTTIENGILSIGSNRAVVYRSQGASGGIVTTARVVGLYSPIGSAPALVNAIYSELSRERPRWARPCRPESTPASAN